MILSSRQQSPPDSMIRTTKYFDTFSTQTTLPPTIIRKPVRIVKAVQRSAQSPSINDLKVSLSTKMNSDNDLKPLTLPYSNESIMNNQQHRSSDYIRNLFPIPDHPKRKRLIQNFETNNMNDIRTNSNDNIRQTEDLLLNLKRTLATLQENQSIIKDEIEMNTILGTKLINIIESKAELNEIEKVKLHISEIDTITSILLKLSSRLAKVENDLLIITDDDNAHTKANLLERREKIQEKHNEAKSLKDGIDRRSRLVTNILRKYLSDEQIDDYDHFIRMKSALLIDAKDFEENIAFLQKQIEILLNTSSLSSSSSPSSPSSSIVNNQQYSSTSSISLFENLQRSNSTSSSSNKVDNLKTNYFNTISTTA
ncbi:unnamed protein product [Rotaria sp. Silwood1]|nr:unnamed protein product [Rotaria sp. Silwood1]CAF1370061.1 unnamed protein product [Rotaria sp. Silwood1]CAF3564929.1 unnamed protein product [Rotaria sp. Silwood1]CAF3632581.1 unnamed protein product [Rotaria sp. Silwood1]CAF4548863.1 unnamed protein product [Rotaria sp. Silwood1]